MLKMPKEDVIREDEVLNMDISVQNFNADIAVGMTKIAVESLRIQNEQRFNGALHAVYRRIKKATSEGLYEASHTVPWDDETCKYIIQDLQTNGYGVYYNERGGIDIKWGAANE